jgi:glucosamine-6-phosphate deaminase
MKVSVHPTADAANEAAADLLAAWLTTAGVRTLMVAAGNTPLDLYRRIGERSLNLGHLTVFALDEYVGVPPDEPRNCANLLRRSVVEHWGIPITQFFAISSVASEALASVCEQEHRIAEAGGVDVIVLGLGQNGHLGFNEPGSAADSSGRVVDLAPVSVEANRKWFGGKYAPKNGATVGLQTILSARRVLLLAYGAHKTAAVTAMMEKSASNRCPASFLQTHLNARVFLDEAAGLGLSSLVSGLRSHASPRRD